MTNEAVVVYSVVEGTQSFWHPEAQPSAGQRAAHQFAVVYFSSYEIKLYHSDQWAYA